MAIGGRRSSSLDQKDLGCLVTLAIDRIQCPIQLATRAGKDRLDERTSLFVQYRFYDKSKDDGGDVHEQRFGVCLCVLVPIISTRKKVVVDRNHLACELKFSKEHLFLCSSPFIWYLREEKLEIQIWTSENDSYDFTESSLSTTDKLLGSVYVDLHSLCDRKRKSHRLSAILPMFKSGAKDLAGASVQIHVTIDKSKDFNELRVRSNEKRHVRSFAPFS